MKTNFEEVDKYSIGYSQKVVSIFSNRRIEKQGRYLLPYLNSNMKILDCGSGPGSMTIGLAKIAHQGSVIGIDISDEQVRLAAEAANLEGVTNVTFHTGSILNIPYKDNTFDFVHIHAVLCQIKDVYLALSEIRRVLKPNGIIAAREPDFDTYQIYPEIPEMVRSMEISKRAVSYIGGDYYIGKKLRHIFTEFGFENAIGSASCETRGTQEGIIKEMDCLDHDWNDSPWSQMALQKKWVTPEEIQSFKCAIQEFAKAPGAFFSFTWGEVVARK